MIDVFFYGLFMDVDILQKNGLHPINLRKGYLKDYTLKIGNRASLIPCKGEKAYGVIMTIDKEAISKLYAEASVADYVSEQVTVNLSANKTVIATCYNLPIELLTGTNKQYAKALYKLAKQLGFPKTYLKVIMNYTH